MERRGRMATIAGAALAARAVARARRRARSRAAGRGAVEDVMPSILEASSAPDPFDEAHAPGHRHLPLKGWVTEGAHAPRGRPRPFLRRRSGLHLPGRG